MELVDFLRETQAAIRDEVEKDIGPGEAPFLLRPYSPSM